MKQKQTCSQGAGRVLRGPGCWLLVVRSALMCPVNAQHRRTTKKARRRTSQDEGSDKANKKKSRPQRGGGFSLNLYLHGVPRWSGVTSHDISRYIVISHPIPCDITRFDMSRYCIHIPNFWDWYRDIVSRRTISRYRTLFFAQLGAPRLVHQDSKINGDLAVELQKQWYLLEKKYVRPYGGTKSADLDAVLRKNNITHYLVREMAANKNDTISQLSDCSSSSSDE